MAKLLWTLSDRTTVTSDGAKITVTGGSEFAKYLTGRAAEGGVQVPEFLPPGGDVPLTPQRARNIDVWIAYEIKLERVNVTVTSRPEIAPLPPPPERDNSDLPPGVQRVY